MNSNVQAKRIIHKNVAFAIALGVFSSGTAIGAISADARVSQTAHKKSKTAVSGQGKTVSYREMTSFSSNTAVTKNDYATLRAVYELPAGDLYSTLGR